MLQLRAVRISNGYTTEQVAKHCDVSSDTILEYEANPSQLPLRLIIQLSDLYAIDPNYLILSS